jgi:hypothetical protein
MLKKDLRTTRLLWAPMAFSFVFFLLMFMGNRWVYLAAGACLTFVAAATPAGIDDRYRTEPFLAALPGTRRSLVKGRYLAWGVFTAAGLGLFLISTALFHAGLGWRSPRLVSLLSMKGASAFLIGALLAGWIFLPLQLRLGFWRGMWTFTAAGFVLSLIGLSALNRLAPVEAISAQLTAALPGILGSMGRGLFAAAWLIDNFLSKPSVIAACAAVLIVLGFLSYRLSVRLYVKRDL